MIKHWSLTTLRETLIKIGAKVVRHARYVFFQMAEVAVPRELFAAILQRIAQLRVLPDSGQMGLLAFAMQWTRHNRGSGVPSP